MTTIIAFIFVFGLIVFFHELGHFLFAKRAGIMVKDFSIGFGPKIFAYRKKKHNIRFAYYRLVAMFGWLGKMARKLS